MAGDDVKWLPWSKLRGHSEHLFKGNCFEVRYYGNRSLFSCEALGLGFSARDPSIHSCPMFQGKVAGTGNLVAAPPPDYSYHPCESTHSCRSPTSERLPLCPSERNKRPKCHLVDPMPVSILAFPVSSFPESSTAALVSGQWSLRLDCHFNSIHRGHLQPVYSNPWPVAAGGQRNVLRNRRQALHSSSRHPNYQLPTNNHQPPLPLHGTLCLDSPFLSPLFFLQLQTPTSDQWFPFHLSHKSQLNNAAHLKWPCRPQNWPS